MKKIIKPAHNFFAFAKFEVHASHFSPAYSFLLFNESTPEKLAKKIKGVFIKKVDEAYSYQEIIDEDDKEYYSELKKDLNSFIDKIKKSENIKQIEKFEGEITIGYPTYEFKILFADAGANFTNNILSALEKDDDFNNFMEYQFEEIEYEDADDTDDNDKRSLALEFQRLRALSPKELNLTEIMDFLERVVEIVYNEEM